MTIPSTARKAGPLLGTGAQTAWPFTFKVFAEADILVSIADAAGVITVQALGADYSVALNSNQETSPGGTVTYPISGAALPVGSKLAIVGDLDYDQPLDLPSGGNFSPFSLENQLDRATMQIQQLKELSDRSAKMSVYSSAEEVEALAAGIIVLAEISTDISAVADDLANIDLVVANATNINTVAGGIANVNAVGTNIANVNTVANDLNEPVSEINTVAENIVDVNTVAGSISAVNTVANNLSLWRDVTAGDDIQVTNFNGTGAQTAFTLPFAPGAENNTQVFISGVYQNKDQYTVAGTTITFSTAPPSGTTNIEVVWSRPFVLGATDAALVGYLPDGVGAVATTQDDINKRTVSVFDKFSLVEKEDALTGAPVIDTTAKIQAAIDGALLLGQRIVGYGTFRIGAAKLVFKGDADFSQATFLVYGAPVIAVEVSTGNATDPTTSLSNTVIHLPKRIENMTKPVTGWAAQGVGVRTVNTYSCQIYIGNIVNFAKNLQCTSFGMGNVYNDYFLRHLENGKVNLDLTPGNAGAWVNENNFFGGRLSHYSAEGTDVAGVRHVYIAASVNSVNNNLFIKPSIEGNVAEFHVECGGSQNTFQQARWEASTPKLRFFGTTTNHGGRNILLGGYGLQDVVVSSSGTTGGNTSIQGGAEQVVVMGSSGKPLRFKNQSANTSAVRQYYDTSGDPFANGSDWTVFESARELRGKRSTDANPRIKIDYHNGAIYFDNGTTAVPTAGFTSFGADSVACSSPLYASTNDAFTCGAAAYRWSIVHATTLSPGTVGTTNATRVKWTSGTGSPESVLTAIVGSMYTRTDGGSGTTLYVKESGAGSTGWVAK